MFALTYNEMNCTICFCPFSASVSPPVNSDLDEDEDEGGGDSKPEPRIHQSST